MKALHLATAVAAAQYPWQDPTLPTAQRVSNLISMLTLSEKVSLMNSETPAIDRIGLPAYAWSAECQRGDRLSNSSTSFPSGQGQGSSFNKTLVYAIGRMTALEVRANLNIAQNHGASCYAPTMNVIRDPRFGRVNEMIGGESPTLNGFLGALYTQGMHSWTVPNPNVPGQTYTMINTIAKHIAVYGGPDGQYGDKSNTMPGMDDARYNTTVAITEREWAEYYLAPWRDVVLLGKTTGFMSSYAGMLLRNVSAATAARLAELGAPVGSGITLPDTANAILLTDKVRNEWGMPGYIISDSGAIACIGTCEQDGDGGLRGHAFARSVNESGLKAFNAGVDLEISCCGIDFAYPTLVSSVANGLLNESAIDTSLARHLQYRFMDATLDGPQNDPWAALDWRNVSSPQAIQLAEEAAEQGVVLLKNSAWAGQPALLPITPSSVAGRTIALVGPNVNDTTSVLGSYGNLHPVFIRTPLDGVVRSYPLSNVSFIQDSQCPNVTNCDAFDPATATAAGQADIIVAVMGISAAINGYTCPAGGSANEKEECDRTTVDLPGAQLPFLQALAATGKPVVLVLLNGGMLDVSWAQASPAIPAIVHLPYLGMATGTAFGRVLAGAVNPAGRVTSTWYSPIGMAAIGGPLEYRMYSDTTDGYPGRTHMYHSMPNGQGVTYPFGFGLSYSTFTYANFRVNVSNPGPCDVLAVSVDVSNTSPVDGSEVVQLYIAHPNFPPPGGLPAVPNSMLVDFARVFIPAHSTQTVTLTLDRYRNSLYSEPDIVSTVFPGTRAFWAGGCSDPTLCAGTVGTVTVGGTATPVSACST